MSGGSWVNGAMLGGGALGGSYLGGKVAESAAKPNAEMAGYLGKQGSLSDMLGSNSRESFNMGTPAISSALGYYNTLAHGNRAQMNAAIAPSVAQITDNYRGAQQAIDSGTTRGGVRDLAKAEMSRDKAGKLALLTTGQQGDAFDKLAGAGMQLRQQGTAQAAGSASILDQMLNNATDRRRMGMKAGADTSSTIGSMIANMLKQGSGGKGNKWDFGGGGTNPDGTGKGTQVTPIDPSYHGQTYPEPLPNVPYGGDGSPNTWPGEGGNPWGGNNSPGSGGTPYVPGTGGYGNTPIGYDPNNPTNW